jgi:predicted MFS family arabinose efflux permease
MRFQVVLFTLARLVLNINTRLVYPFLPVFARGLGVDLATISLVVMGRSIAGALIPFFSPIADHQGRKTGLLSGLGLFAIANGVIALWPSFLSFSICLILSMLGLFIFLSSLQAYLGDRVPYASRGMVIAITELGWSGSFILGMPLMGLVIARYGWAAPFPILSVLALLLWVMLARWIPATPPDMEKVNNLWHNLRTVLSSPTARAGLAIGLCMNAANEIINLVFGVWMEDSFGLQIAALGAASAVIGFGELGGEGLSAALADRLGKERAIITGMSLTGMIALALPWLGGNLWGALAGLFLFYLMFEFSIVSTLPLLTELAPEARATLMGLNLTGFSLGRGLGAFLAPRIYQLGFQANAAAALALILLAGLALSQVRLRPREGS